MTPEQIKKVLIDTLAAIKSGLLSSLGSSEALVISTAQSYIVDGEDRLAALLNAMASGDGDAKFLLRRLSDEKNILLGQFLSIEVIAKGIVQSAINNAQDILLNAIRSVLP
jgi:hypothetical protein